MLVHDIRKNESRVIDFRETAPSGLREEMLQDLKQKVNKSCEFKGGATSYEVHLTLSVRLLFGLVWCGLTLKLHIMELNKSLCRSGYLGWKHSLESEIR